MAPAPPTSPPKRVTRARAAAKKAGDDSEIVNTNIAPKPSFRKRNERSEEESAETDLHMVNNDEPLRKSARRGATSAPARRIKVTPLNSIAGSELQLQQDNNSEPNPKKSRATRSKKATADEAGKDEAGKATEPTKTKRQAVSVARAKDTTKSTALKPRGRPKKAELIQEEDNGESVKIQKKTRARTGPSAANSRPLAAAPSKTTIPKKRVTFQDVPECDKENLPVLKAKATMKGKPATGASGIKAKPIRRPAATSRAAKPITTKVNVEAMAQRVLTPKKVTQIARSTSPADSDDDELSGAKTPIRDLSQSPRRNVNISRTGSPVKKLDFGGELLASSPAKSQLMSTISSPAKRPPPSPFKEAFKESPRRGDLPFKLSQAPKFQDADKVRNPISASSAMLLQSPKRVALETAMFPPSTSKSSKSSFKASLLQSPPKRPISPSKVSSAIKTRIGPTTPSKEVTGDAMSPDVAVSSHSRASPSPERSSRVYRMTPEEQMEETRCAIDFDESVVDIRSPLKPATETLNVFDQARGDVEVVQADESDAKEDCLMTQAEIEPDAQTEAPTRAEDIPTTELERDIEDRTAVPASIMLRDQTPANTASFLFQASRTGDDDESSEDELQSPVKMFQAQTPATVGGNKPGLSIINRAAIEQNPGFTPLAAQLSGWLASSPDQQPIKKHQLRGIFSPVAAQHVPGEVIIDRRSPATSRVSTGPRLSMAARRSIGGRKSLGQRSSLAISTSGTPDKSTYFSDEMVVKDLEEAIESMQADHEDCDMLQEAINVETFDHSLLENLAPGEAAEGVEVAQIQEVDDSHKLEDVGMNTPAEASRDLPPEIEAKTMAEEGEDRQQEQETSHESTASSAYGDENVIPTSPTGAVPDPVLAQIQQSSTTPALIASASNPAPPNELVTPPRPQQSIPRFANTVVSKVPLRPEGHIFPLQVSKKRSRSLSAGPSSVKKTPVLQVSQIPRSSTVNTFSPSQSTLNTPSSATTTPGQQSFALDDFGDSTLDGIEVDDDDENLPPITPTIASVRSFAATPSKTPKAQTPAAASGVLQGAVVFVDVHTTEGADASGIFVELLTQMGAKCVKNWSWNPRASMGVNVEEAASTSGAAKVGITHVVYKDGGKRTLEKVRGTEGVVKCVGVGWILDCERESKWLDESTYAVDTSIIPRGGSRRRKSMEPKALLNMNGNLSQAAGPSRRSFSAEMTQKFKAELVSTTVRGRASEPSGPFHEDDAAVEAEADTEPTRSIESGFSTPTGAFAVSTISASATNLPPATPTGFVDYDPSSTSLRTPGGGTAADGVDAAYYSPTTPYYLSQGAKLVQMTCPPKQTGKGLFGREGEEEERVEEERGVGSRFGDGGRGFPLSGRLADVKDEKVRKRLAEARRRTLGWKPRVGSPLGR